jgi:tRNA U34 5-carboxymethylaminomethyl modifying GTPase MnmE/TrmE
MKLDSSPIVAIATAPGRGGIGIVRISGKNLMPIAQAVCKQPADIYTRFAINTTTCHLYRLYTR